MIQWLEALGVSTAVVALAEIGDKTQLLAIVLAARYRRPVPVVLGILAATLLNHALAGLFGAWLATLAQPQTLRWILGVGFLAMAIWALIPDRIDTPASAQPRAGVFVATAVAFFVVEMGDKTQIATVALAARYDTLFAVVAGTTLGMMIANVPAVWFGDRAAARLPLQLIRSIAAAIFLVLAVLVLVGIGPKLG